VTGYGGTTQQASVAPGAVSHKPITIRFDANLDPGLSWSFKPVAVTQTVQIGENALAFYRASNLATETITGTATFNVTPEIAGQYFSKIECFCFSEQTLKPGETVEMPVSFFVDPAILKDPDASAITEITLSYTFFRSGTDVGAAVSEESTAAGG
jgi:cytochrome c oxidase assembly protein subunit 11